MQLTFWGAAQTVTGSCYALDAAGLKILIDCGQFQGSDEMEEMNRGRFPFSPAAVDFLLLTHAHIDHSGLIPKLCRDGFRGKIIATRATAELCRILLLDSAHIHEMEAEWQNRKKKRAGTTGMEPLYTTRDAENCLVQFAPVGFGETVALNDSVRVRFHSAGHIFGAASIEINVREEEKTTSILFSGDIGRENQPIIRDPDTTAAADYLVMESTYGNRRHTATDDTRSKLAEVIRGAIRKNGKVIIPAFAVGRTQDILYELNYLVENKLLPPLPVFIDSPLAIAATEIFTRHPEIFDRETRELLARGDDPFAFPGLQFARTTEESKALNQLAGAAVIISASGMCQAGRIRHHLKHNLWRPEATILLVGFQAKGTLGRRLLEGEKQVKLFGEEIAVGAQIVSLDGFSAHADAAELIEWVKKLPQLPRQVFVAHGEEEAARELAAALQQEVPTAATVPARGDSYALTPAGAVPAAAAPAAKGPSSKAANEFAALRRQLAALLADGAAPSRLSAAELNELNERLRYAAEKLSAAGK